MLTLLSAPNVCVLERRQANRQEGAGSLKQAGQNDLESWWKEARAKIGEEARGSLKEKENGISFLFLLRCNPSDEKHPSPQSHFCEERLLQAEARKNTKLVV